MANEIIPTLIGTSNILRASLLRDINNQATVLYKPAEGRSVKVANTDPAIYPYVTTLTTGSTSYVDIPGATAEIASSGRRLFVITHFHTNVGGSSVFEVVTLVDGVVQTNSNRSLTNNAVGQGAYLFTYHFITPVIAAGQHTVKLQVKRLSGSNNLTLNTVQDYQLIVREY